MKRSKRTAGILMPISALPSPYGIGTLGKAAYDFADFLHAAGQSLWQVLPIGPTGYGDSPYQSFSTFAGNPYFIDLDLLVQDGLLDEAVLAAEDWQTQPTRVDYGKIYVARFRVLRRAFVVGYPRDKEELAQFSRENPWVENYALYMAVKQHFDMKSWQDWPDDDIRLRRPQALAAYREQLAEDVAFYSYLQYLFYRQWNALRDYVHGLGIRIVGDLPIYVSMDSADVWAEPQFFQLDKNGVPTEVAGVPPDYFSEDGQLWGNPLYDWDAMKADGFGWWIRRVEGAGRLYDVIRIDHFRGLESYWAVPYGAENARDGRWRAGPGMALVGVLTSWFYQLDFIAEDLGILTPAVRQLLEDSGLPGMKVLEFAFDSREPSAYLPHHHVKNCICYVGTHDNETAVQWSQNAPAATVEYAAEYLGFSGRENAAAALLRAGMASVADTFIAQMQDWLALGAEARMNAPGVVGGNWQWRLCADALTDALAARIAALTALYDRAPAKKPENGIDK